MPPERLADRLADAVADALVGRDAESDRLRGLLTADPGPAVVFVQGPGGIGKTMLLHGTLDRHRLGAVRIDGRHVEPTPAGTLAAIGAALGAGALDSITAAAAAMDAAGSPILAIDGYERLGIIDGWLRNDLLPRLPARVRTVLVGRNPPNLAWRTSPGWRRLIAEQVVGPLTEPDAEALLGRHHLPPEVAERALRFGRGHPLALVLAAEAFGRRPDVVVQDGPPPEVVEELVDVIYDGLSAQDRRMAEAVCVLRRITEPLLAAVLEEEGASPADTSTAWRALRALPFTTVTRTGLELHPVIQDVMASALELRKPRHVRELRRRAARAALAEVSRSPGWELTADILHLVQKPILRAAFVPPAGFQHPVEAARPDDRDAVLAIVAEHVGPTGVDVMSRWWRSHRSGFVVSRGEYGDVTAFSVVVEVADLDRSLAHHDPLVAVVLDDLASRGLPPGGRALFNRHALSARCGSEPAPELAPMMIDIKRTYLELRPHLARVYVIAGSWEASGEMMRQLGFKRVGPSVDIDRITLHPCSLDFGPGSVDAWLAAHVEAESSTEVPGEDLGAASPSSAVGVQALSPREREVLAALADGLSNHELAERLFISERTANRHLSNIYTKLGVRNRTAAARVAIESGLAI